MVARAKHAVLIVDDDESILSLITRQLEGLLCTIIPTSSSAEAIHILKSREIAVLLCDLNMPEIGGNVVLTTAREANPNIISILITGASDHSATIKAINEGGISKYLAKPWKKEEFVAIVTEGLEQYEHLCHQQAKLESLACSLETHSKNIFPSQKNKKESDPDKRSRKKQNHKKTKASKRDQLVNDRYKLGKIIGQGGMGTVFKATDLLLDMPVAIKVLHPRFTHDDSAIATLKELIASYHGEVYLIGSSLGGFYATYLSQMPQVQKVVLINPATKPMQTLSRALGEVPNFYDDSYFKWDESHLKMLEKYLYEFSSEMLEIEKFFVLIQKGDELLNYRDAEQKYKNSKLIVEDGGSHSFDSIERHCENIRAFFTLGTFPKELYSTKI